MFSVPKRCDEGVFVLCDSQEVFFPLLRQVGISANAGPANPKNCKKASLLSVDFSDQSIFDRFFQWLPKSFQVIHRSQQLSLRKTNFSMCTNEFLQYFAGLQRKDRR